MDTKTKMAVKNIKQLAERRLLTEILLSEVEKEKTDLRSRLDTLKAACARVTGTQRKAQFMIEAAKAYLSYRRRLTMIIRQSEAING